MNIKPSNSVYYQQIIKTVDLNCGVNAIVTTNSVLLHVQELLIRDNCEFKHHQLLNKTQFRLLGMLNQLSI